MDVQLDRSGRRIRPDDVPNCWHLLEMLPLRWDAVTVRPGYANDDTYLGVVAEFVNGGKRVQTPPVNPRALLNHPSVLKKMCAKVDDAFAHGRRWLPKEHA
jgi:hypothetical protein